MRNDCRMADRAGRLRVCGATALLVFTLLLSLSEAASVAQAACTKEAIRAEQGAVALALPECRAYELVSPGSTPVVFSGSGRAGVGVRAAGSGEAVAYYSYDPEEADPTSGLSFRSSRGSDGWTVEAVTPQREPDASGALVCEPEIDYSADLTESVLGDGWELKRELPSASSCAHPEAELVPGEPIGFGNLYLQDFPGAPYQLVNNITQAVGPTGNARFQDASSDFSHIVFSEEAELTPEAPSGEDLYEWYDGAVHLVSVLPGRVAVNGRLVGTAITTTESHGAEGVTLEGSAASTNAVSASGERVFFYAEGALYARLNAVQEPSPVVDGECTDPKLACTVQLDVSQGAGASGGGVFQYADAEGTRVFFTDESNLTTEATATSGKPDLYEYDLDSGALTDLTTDATEPANVRGFSGAGEDGSYLYFVADGALTGAQQNSAGAVAKAKKPNLYQDHEGAITFIATLEPKHDAADWQEEGSGESITTNDGELTARVSPGGEFIAFNSRDSLTGFDNDPAAASDCAGEACTEIYLYSSASGQLSCVSCAPNGSRPTAPTEISPPIRASERPLQPGYLSRNVSESGQVFFTTADALLPQDKNGVSDVYEWDAGQLQLISDGEEGSSPSVFFEASANGDDVFFATSDALVRADTSNAERLYDARVEGGFAEPPLAPPACEGEACHGPSSSSRSVGTASTAEYRGPGNQASQTVTKCKKGLVKREGRCVKKPKRHKQKKKSPKECKKKSRRHCAKKRKKSTHHSKASRGKRAAGKGRRAGR